ncbi:MAG: phosphodiesterase [Clostridiales bacterium]|nr:phosphodiesterase [Clostridiales bacterium]
MKWLIASDIHGSAKYCAELMRAYDRERADRLLLLGDILYHGPRNDLPEGYRPKEVIALMQGVKDVTFSVRGNCEAEVDQMVLPFPCMAEYVLLPVGERLVFATHGHVFNKQNTPPMKDGDILLHGHTHIPAWEDCGRYMYLNPGSVSIPKDGTWHGYMTLEDGVFRWKTLAGEEKHALAL